jgi:hypothetical protein
MWAPHSSTYILSWVPKLIPSTVTYLKTKDRSD